MAAHAGMRTTLEVLPGCTSLSGAEIEYLPEFMDIKLADTFLAKLCVKVRWHQPVIRIFSREAQSPRLAAWYGDADAVYQYSGLLNEPLPWLEELTDLRGLIQQQLGHTPNSVLLNLYRDGNDSMGWHRDSEPELGKNPVIVSVSLGGTRRFLLRHVRRKDLPTLELRPTHGSLLLMRGQTQRYWRHAVPKTRQQVAPRLNLTFRRVDSEARIHIHSGVSY